MNGYQKCLSKVALLLYTRNTSKSTLIQNSPLGRRIGKDVFSRRALPTLAISGRNMQKSLPVILSVQTCNILSIQWWPCPPSWNGTLQSTLSSTYVKKLNRNNSKSQTDVFHHGHRIDNSMDRYFFSNTTSYVLQIFVETFYFKAW